MRPVLALTATRLFDGFRMLERHAVLVEGDRVRAVVPAGDIPAGARRRDLGGGLLAPGFIDLQVNGGGGVLFNDDPTPGTIRAIGRAHRRFGTTGFLPTLITDVPDTLPAAVAAARAVMAEPPDDAARVLGVHLEGPFLNVARRGVHAAEHIRAMTEDDIALLCRLAGGPGRILVTLAPECVPPGAIRRLTGAGLIVAAGHTAATYDEIQAALAEGLAGFTHLFNAMSPFGSREPGTVGAALAAPEAWCGIIADGHHVHPAALRVAVAAKSRGLVLLVTDAMPPVGAADPSFRLYGQTITATGGRCTTADGTLAGSALDMAGAVRNAVDLLGLPVEHALRMASAYPASALFPEPRFGRLVPGRLADLVLLDDDLRAIETWVGGVESGGGSRA